MLNKDDSDLSGQAEEGDDDADVVAIGENCVDSLGAAEGGGGASPLNGLPRRLPNPPKGAVLPPNREYGERGSGRDKCHHESSDTDQQHSVGLLDTIALPSGDGPNSGLGKGGRCNPKGLRVSVGGLGRLVGGGGGNSGL